MSTLRLNSLSLPDFSAEPTFYKTASSAVINESNSFLAPSFTTDFSSAAGSFSPFCNPFFVSDADLFLDIFHSAPSSEDKQLLGHAFFDGDTPGNINFYFSDTSIKYEVYTALISMSHGCYQAESNGNGYLISPISTEFGLYSNELDVLNWFCPAFFSLRLGASDVDSPYGISDYEFKFNFSDCYNLDGCKCQVFFADSVGFKPYGDPIVISNGSIRLSSLDSLPRYPLGGGSLVGFLICVPFSHMGVIEDGVTSGKKRFKFNTYDYSVGDDGENELFQIGHRWMFSGLKGVVDFSTTDFDNPLGTSDVPISALPFRAYEMIYNSFYRDARNNPYVLDGEVQYNQFIPTIDGGEDNNIYPLRYRNWEYDFLTTSQPTPQFGNAPLVGITPTGTMTFQASEDGKEYNVQAQVGDDGTTVESVSYTENLPNSVARSLVDVVSSGISINDFRNVNSFQRFLETTMRRGLKAVDQLKAHFDVNASYNALDMPEFIGGISTVVDAQKVNNLNGDGSAPLGDYAGQLSCMGNQKHKVRCYCDEPGFIIGIVCVHPVPLYSQLLPKHFLKRSNLDYFFPEFGHIGLQPILQREVAPLQVSASNDAKQTDVFGYQRAWYDYLSSVDEVHGLFRTQLRDYVLNRSFYGVPKLSPEFTVINPEHLNDIFTVQNISDKILGKIVFNVKAVRPIPKYGIPKID